MEMTKFGAAGLPRYRASVLDTMTYGSPQWRDWVLDEEAKPAFHQGGRSTPESISSIRPISILTAQARRCWDAR